MNKTIILNLQDKNYVRAFGLMSPEEQECFEKVGKQGNCLRFDGKIWADDIGYGSEFVGTITYAIKADYQPEPEFVDLEIVEVEQDSGKWLGVHRDAFGTEFLPYQFTHLHCLPSLPDFNGVYLMKGGHGFVGSDFAAEKIAEGHKVYARFRT